MRQWPIHGHTARPGSTWPHVGPFESRPHSEARRGLGGPPQAGSLEGPLTEMHPVPLAECVHVAAQVVQHPGG